MLTSMRCAAKLAVMAALTTGSTELSLAQEHPTTKDFRVSLSVSPFTELAFRYGISFTDGKVTAKSPEDLQRMFVAHGANEVYVRVATTQRYHTGFGDHSMDRALERARMAKALDLPLNPELGLFNI